MQDRSFPFTRSRDSIATVMTDLTAEEQEFTLTVERHHHELQRHCVRLTGSRADAEDALQETLLRAWRFRRARSSASPRAWLYRIATNACFDVVAARRNAAATSLEDDTPVSFPDEQAPDAQVLARETIELALLAAIQHLPARQRATLVMRDVLGWTADDVATALSTTVPATNSALQRARRGLRARLASSRLSWTREAPGEQERETLERYLSAIEAGDAETAAQLLTCE
jgi:RNA polymerase sigma-70 factor, ECF subfamily